MSKYFSGTGHLYSPRQRPKIVVVVVVVVIVDVVNVVKFRSLTCND